MASNHERSAESNASERATSKEDDNGEPYRTGYDVELVGQSDLKENSGCVICLHILREPMQAVPCGHRFCKVCSEKLKVPGR